MSIFPSSVPSLPTLTYQRPVHVLIDYKEAYDLLKHHEKDFHPDMWGDTSTLLEVMVHEYFSRYQAVQLPGLDVVERFRNQNPYASQWEQSAQAMAVTLLIIKTTQAFLPNFSAHRSEDCVGILNIVMHSPHTVMLEIDPLYFARFVQSPSV